MGSAVLEIELPGLNGPAATVKDVLDANESALETVAQNQLFLKAKMQDVLLLCRAPPVSQILLVAGPAAGVTGPMEDPPTATAD